MLATKLIFYLVFCVWTGNGLPNLLSPSASYDADQCSTGNRFRDVNNVNETLEINGVCAGPIDTANYTDITFVDNDECQKYFNISIKDTEASIILIESLDEVFDNDRLIIAPCSIDYTCKDGSSYSATSVTINILPENDNAPFFWDNNNTAVVNISKQFTPGMPIPGFNIIAQDNDFEGRWTNEHEYQDNVILCEDPGDLIGCSTTKIEDGVYEFSLTLKRAVGPGDKNPFKFNLKAYDNGTESLAGSNTQEVTINFEASDQFPPAFEKLYYHGNIPNATWENSVDLVTIKATDPDLEINATILYSIDQEELAKTCDNQCFKIHEKSGVLSWSGELSDEVIKNRLVEVLVTATEDSELNKSNTTVVVFTVTGDDHPPKFDKEIYKRQIDDQGSMDDISFTVSDLDTALSQTLKFRLIGEPDPNENFEIKGNTVTLKQGFDINSNNLPLGGRVSFNLEVVDEGDETKLDRSLVIVTYPWNQKNPKFTTSSLKGNVSSGVVELDYKLSAVDGDEIKSEIEYELLDPAGSGEFTLDTAIPDDVKIEFSGDSSPYRHVTLIVKASEKNPKSGMDSRMDIATVFVTVGEPTLTTITTVTSEPTTPEPATSEPATSEPATSEPATSEPATSEPATSEPVTSEPTTTHTECPTCEPPTPCPTDFPPSTTISTTTDSSTSSSCPPPPPCPTNEPTNEPTTTCPSPTPCPECPTYEPPTPCPTDFPSSTTTSSSSTTTGPTDLTSSTTISSSSSTTEYSPTSIPEDETIKFISGDDQTSQQNVGYPSFVMLENSVPMPITRVVAVCSSNSLYNGQITYSISGATSSFHVHKTTGEVFVTNALEQLKLSDVCSPTCDVDIRATLVTQAGAKTDNIKLTVTALDENQLAVFSSEKSASDAETVVEKINNYNNASVWFRLVNTQPSEASHRTRTGQGSKTWAGQGSKTRTGQGSLLFLTAREGEAFINKEKAADIIANMEDMDVVEDVDTNVYHPTEPPPTNGGLVAAVVVLAILLGCIPLAVLAFFAYKKRSSLLSRLPTRNNASKMDKMGDSGDGYEDMNYFNEDDRDKEKTKANNNKPKMGQPVLGKANHGLMREMSTELEKRLETKQSSSATPSAVPPAASSNSVARALPPPSADYANEPTGEARQLQFIKPPQKKKAPAAPPSAQPADGVRFNEKAEVVEVDKDGDKASVAGSMSSVTSSESESSSEASTSSEDEDVTVM